MLRTLHTFKKNISAVLIYASNLQEKFSNQLEKIVLQ